MGRDEDLNQRKREQALLDMAALGPKILDRYGRPILIGCEIEFHDTIPPVYVVLDAKPDLRPNAQPGVWHLELGAQLVVAGINGQRLIKTTVVNMPQPQPAAEANEEQTTDPASGASASADSDTPAGPQSSIVLTDLDRTARESLTDAQTAQSEATPKLSLVPPPPPGIPEIDHGGES